MGRATAPARAPQDPAITPVQAGGIEPGVAAGPQPAAEPRGPSSWRLLLEQLDALLRDPTLTRALAASYARFTAALQGLSAAAREALKRLARAAKEIRLRLPRRLLLALLALTLPLALLALVGSSRDDRPAAGGAGQQPGSRPATGAAGGFTLPAVGMPDLRPAPDEVRQVRVALVVDRTYDARPLRRELRALDAWLAGNHAPGTRVSVIRAGRGASTTAAIRSAFARGEGRRLLVALATPVPAVGPASRLRVTPRPGAAAGPGVALRRGGRAHVTIDDRRPNALAASVARAIMAISGQREQR